MECYRCLRAQHPSSAAPTEPRLGLQLPRIRERGRFSWLGAPCSSRSSSPPPSSSTRIFCSPCLTTSTGRPYSREYSEYPRYPGCLAVACSGLYGNFLCTSEKEREAAEVRHRTLSLWSFMNAHSAMCASAAIRSTIPSLSVVEGSSGCVGASLASLRPAPPRPAPPRPTPPRPAHCRRVRRAGVRTVRRRW